MLRSRRHTTTAGPHLVRIIRLGFVNAWLVVEDDGLTLVDTAVKGSEKAILGRAHELGAAIRRIVLTHAHADHTGSLDALVRTVPGVEVLISERDALLLAGDRQPRPGEPLDAKLRGGYSEVRTRPTGLLSAGDRVGSLEVVATPGHTPGHIALLDTRDGTLLAGDALVTLGGVSTPGRMNRRFPLPYLATWHRPTALASARALRALDPTRLAVGHGPLVPAPGRALDAAIARAS